METGGVAVGRSEIATSSLEWLSISLLEWYRIYLLDIRMKQLTDLADVVWCHYSIVRISYKSLLTTHRPLHCIHILNQTSSLSSPTHSTTGTAAPLGSSTSATISFWVRPAATLEVHVGTGKELVTPLQKLLS